MVPALLMLVATANGITLFDDVVRVPRLRWSALNFTLQQRPATVECRYQVAGGNGTGAVRLVLMTREDVERMGNGEDYRVLVSTDYGTTGRVAYQISRPGNYMVLIDNRTGNRGRTLVNLHVGLIFNEYTSFSPRTASPERRGAVAAISLIGFAAIGGWAGMKILSAVRRQRSAGLPQP